MEIRLVKRWLLGGLFFAIPSFLLFTLPLKASAQESADEELPLALYAKFIGGDNEALYFNVKYDNKAGHNFRLLVLDETGEACFQDNYSTRDFEKKIKIPRLTDTDYVIFLIRSAKENIQLSYKVKVTTKVADETVFLKNRELVSYK
jgi:hypothetical protein